jgi:TRAP-type mannitol/chloroaromatic compound transport system substrate-binding protein
MTLLGVEVENLATGDLASALDSGDIDAAEFIGPEDDKNLGLQERARFYYYPGFWEPSASLEIQIDLDRWNELPATYQEAIRSAAAETMLWTMALYDARNGQALNDLVAAGTELRVFPDEVMEAARAASGLLLDGIASGDEDFARVLEHWRSFRRQVTPWFNLAEASLLR